jgi:hypothetical protein
MSYLYGGSDSDDEHVVGGDWGGFQEDVPEESSEFVDFKKNILNAKYKLYEANVLSDKIPADMTQSPQLLNNYIKNLEQFYVYSINLQNKTVEPIDINVFPEESRDSIQLALNIVKDFFSRNSIPETIPYSNFIRTVLKEHPYIHKDPSEDTNGTEAEE